MAKQLNLLSAGRVIATALHSEMEQSYLEYAMSVIVGRALPDVRDGLKPVHRRILYAMHELGLTPDRPYRKCARVVGDVLGKYHPHGDQAVYDALVRMVQRFSSRYPLLDGHGNFGSVDNDPPAAMRYTETRLSGFGNAILLDEVGEETVNYVGNFDNSQQEPVVLPAQLPALLINGCSGIAVGMATNIPPHNVGEIIDALIALIDRPDLDPADIQALVPGPDFPTGGEIIGTTGITEAYDSGRGSITVRAVTAIEEVQPGRGRHRRSAIVVTELPYQVNKAGCVEKIAALINQGRLEGIADLRDESDRDGMRIVIELKRETRPEVVLEQLYRQTPLQSNFGVIMLALVEGQPRQLSLKEALQAFLSFREQTLTRRYRHQLETAQTRLHLVAGLRQALTHLDDVIEVLRQAPDGSTAKVDLQALLDLSDRQADAILAMPLRRLTGLEQQNLHHEFTELTEQIEQLEHLLRDRKELLKTLKKDLRSLKRKYDDPRRTHIIADASPKTVALPEPDGPVTVEINQRGYVRCLRSRPKARTQPPLNQLYTQEKDWSMLTWTTERSNRLLVFTAGGKAYQIDVKSMPITSAKARGVPLVTLLPESAREEELVAHMLTTEIQADMQVLLLTQQGRVKSIPMADFSEVTARGLAAIKLKDDDRLGWVVPVTTATDVAIATNSGRLIRVPIGEIPSMGRNAQGNRALRLRQKEQLVGMAALNDDQDVLMITSRGYAKRLPIDFLRPGKLGDLGSLAIQFSRKSETLVALLSAVDLPELRLISNQERIARIETESLPMHDKGGAGTALVKLAGKEQITTVLPLGSPG